MRDREKVMGRRGESKKNDVAADREGSQAISTADIANVQR